MQNRLRLFIAGILMVLIGCSSDFVETSTTRYSNYEEAAVSGAVRRGWLPLAFPATAHDIVETHNIDTNEVWISFHYKGDGINELISHCTEHPNIILPSARRVMKLVPWWPLVLTDQKGEKFPHEMRVYYCQNMSHSEVKLNAALIVDPKKSTAWYWIIP